MSDLIITIASKRGIDSSVLSEQLANFLHSKGLTVELASKPVMTNQHKPQAVKIRTHVSYYSECQGVRNESK